MLEMTEPKAGIQKEWEKFDEVSLKKIDAANEEEFPEGRRKEYTANETTSDENKVSHDPLRSKSTFDEEIDVPPTIPPVIPSTTYGLQPVTSSIPTVPISSQQTKSSDSQQKSQVFLDVSRLDDSVSRIARASAISDPKNVNAKILATVFPDNVVCDWVTPPHYDAYSMPSILAIDVPTLSGEDYIATIKTIIEDSRFKMFSTIYSRLIAIWMAFWIFSLAISLLFQSKGGWPVMIWCLIWTALLFVGVYVCAMIRRKIRIGLNHVVANANKNIVDRHFLAGVEDRGQLSCHKVVIHFIRFNVGDCTADVMKLLKIKKSGGCVFGENVSEEQSDESVEREAAALILEYSQEYVKGVVKKRLIFPSKPIYGVSNYVPKHCKTQMCLCQFIDDRKFNAKPKKWYARYI